MLMVNIILMGRSVWEEFSLPFDGWTVSEQYVYWLNFLFLEGAGRAMFTILFGASFMIMLAKTMEPSSPIGPADLYYRRCLWMVLFGILHATILLWPGDILFHYAAPAMALLPFRTAKAKHILYLVTALLLVLAVLRGAPDFLNGYTKQAAEQALAKRQSGQPLTAADNASISAWDDAIKDRRIDYASLAKETKARQSYFTSVAFQADTWWKWFDQQTPVWALEAFTFMLLGIALFKLGILTGARSTSFYVAMVAIVVPLSLMINGFEAWVKWATNRAPDVWWDDVTYQLGRIAMALSYIGVLMLVYKKNWGKQALVPLQTLGRMPLTSYLGQSLMAAILFTGFGLFGKLNNAELWGLALGMLLVQYLFSRWWLEHYRMGPMEWVWRSLVHWEFQPLMRPRFPRGLPSSTTREAS